MLSFTDRPVYERYQHDRGWIQVLAHNQFLVTVSSNVDGVFKRTALDELNLSPLQFLTASDVESEPGSAGGEPTADQPFALPDTVMATALRRVLPYRLVGLPRGKKRVS